MQLIQTSWEQSLVIGPKRCLYNKKIARNREGGPHLSRFRASCLVTALRGTLHEKNTLVQVYSIPCKCCNGQISLFSLPQSLQKVKLAPFFCSVCGKGNMRDLSVVGYVKLDSFARLPVAQFDEEEVD